MRQLIVKVPKGNKEKIEESLRRLDAKNTIYLDLNNHEAFITHVTNKKVNNLLENVSDIDDHEISLIPRGIINLYPPAEDSPDQVADVQPKSALEIFFGGIQSVGSLFGFLGYAFAAGLIVWIGFYTTTVYLLVAAMLIAPYAGPAMNAALATASGKADLLKSSLLRYGLAILSGVVASFIMCLLFPLQTLTPLMNEVSQVSAVALFLPIISGFAGAINICQSERDSLVSGAAVGILVAASLAPPVGLIGAGLYLQDWEVLSSSLFRITLQLLGIHLSATLVFIFYGKISTDGVRFLKGSDVLRNVVIAVVVLGIGAMIFWQFSQPPFLQKASMNTELTELLNKEMEKLDYIKVVEKNVSFSRNRVDDKPIAIFAVTVLPNKSVKITSEELRNQIIEHLKQNIHVPEKNIYKTYTVEVLKD